MVRTHLQRAILLIQSARAVPRSIALQREGGRIVLRRIGLLLCGAVLLEGGLAMLGCRNAPMTGRRQFVAIPEQEEIRLGEETWRKILAERPRSRNQEQAQMVERVGRRLAAVSGQSDYQWEFQLLESPEPNAFALPGGKIAVNEGILPICENEAGLAVVMSHELAHVLARHGGERMSQEGAVNLAGGVLGKALDRHPEEKQQRWLNAYGVASKVGVLLPYSRQHETEADSIGLNLMARAGYDPQEAQRFWQRFSRLHTQQTPEFLSTHPCDAHRASHLEGLMPQALALYRAAPQQLGTGLALGALAPTAQSTPQIQLAGHEQPSRPRVQTAVYEGEFLPPIERRRSDDEVIWADAVDVTVPGPRPFPAAVPAKPIGDGGWKPTQN